MKPRPPASLEDLAGQPAALYVRVSSVRQGKRYGIPAQVERGERFAAAYGIRIAEIYRDDRTGTNASRREAFQRMLADAIAGRFRVVIVAYVSRWARDEFDGFATLKAIHDAAGCLVVADRALLSTDRRRFTELARELVEAGDYSRKLSETITTTIEEHVRLRVDVWGELPHGFRRRGEHHVAWPDPATMAVAVEVYDRAAGGSSDQRIADLTGLTLWTVRGILRSRLYVGDLPDGRTARFTAPVERAIAERAWAHRRRRTHSGHVPRYRVYPLTDRGPLVCERCDRPLKGTPHYGRAGELTLRYVHPDPCTAWPIASAPVEELHAQVQGLLRPPDRAAVAAIRAALAEPPAGPDRLALARIEARLRGLAGALVSDDRPTREVLEEIEEAKAERTAELARATPRPALRPAEAVEWLGSLADLWARTDAEGRRELALALFDRIGAADRRIVSVTPTQEAADRGLVLALPTRLEATGVGGAGARPTPATPWPIRVAGRREWIAAARRVG